MLNTQQDFQSAHCDDLKRVERENSIMKEQGGERYSGKDEPGEGDVGMEMSGISHVYIAPPGPRL